MSDQRESTTTRRERLRLKWHAGQKWVTNWVDEHWGLLRLASLGVWVIGGVIVIFGVIAINLETQEISSARATTARGIEETARTIEGLVLEVKSLQEENLSQGERIESLVNFVNSLQSAETDEAIRATLVDLLAVADCDNREVFQTLMDALEEAGLISGTKVLCDVPPPSIDGD